MCFLLKYYLEPDADLGFSFSPSWMPTTDSGQANLPSQLDASNVMNIAASVGQNPGTAAGMVMPRMDAVVKEDTPNPSVDTPVNFPNLKAVVAMGQMNIQKWL